MNSPISHLMTRPYLCRADGFLTLNSSAGRRAGTEVGLLGIGTMVLILAVAAAAGISAVMM